MQELVSFWSYICTYSFDERPAPAFDLVLSSRQFSMCKIWEEKLFEYIYFHLFIHFSRREIAIMMEQKNEDIFKPTYSIKKQDNISGSI